jgi:hypothetical protein
VKVGTPRENVASGDVKLESADLRSLGHAVDWTKISGKGYADWIMASVDRCARLCWGSVSLPEPL